VTALSEAIVHHSGTLTFQGETFRAALGRGGVRLDKTEGDGATPVGVLPLRRIFYRADRLTLPVSAVPVAPAETRDGWCDDPGHPDYNRHVQLPHAAGCEALWRDDHIYDIIGVLGWNDEPIAAGIGSAIFLHAARPDFSPTEGCVALTIPALRRVLEQGLTALRILPPSSTLARPS